MTAACFQETVGMGHPRNDDRVDRFIFFDMGNVLLNFDHQVAWQQMARLCKIDPDVVRKTVFEDPMQLRYERGELSSQEFYESFCQRLQVQPDYELLMKAASDIFQPAEEVIQIVVGLKAAGCQLGLLSNTCEAHWDWIQALGFRWLETCFEKFVLSYQVHCLKPDPEIYVVAAREARRTPAELLLIDDRSENVVAAREAGWDAIHFTGVVDLVEQLQLHQLIDPNERTGE
jgi:FMN phosphatase YigB (HAD superfamily)